MGRLDESFPDTPRTLYSIHKLMAEKYLELYGDKCGIQSVILRLPNVYGPGVEFELSRRVVLNRIISRAVGGKPLLLFGNRRCTRDYLFIDDLVEALLLAGHRTFPGHCEKFILGSGIGYRIEEMVHLVADRVSFRTGRTPDVRVDEDVTLDPIEWRDFVANHARFSAMTGWSPEVGLAEGIDRTLDYFLREGGIHSP
jgi:nucleoside-diphosphate-sugar epimerase